MFILQPLHALILFPPSQYLICYCPPIPQESMEAQCTTFSIDCSSTKPPSRTPDSPGFTVPRYINHISPPLPYFSPYPYNCIYSASTLSRAINCHRRTDREVYYTVSPTLLPPNSQLLPLGIQPHDGHPNYRSQEPARA